MEDFSKQCFVCKTKIDKNNSELNEEVNLPVCKICKGTDREKEMAKEYLSGLADDFVCGCI